MAQSTPTLEDDPLIETVKEELKDENRGGIVSALRLYSPLNLKGLSKILAKAESTLHPHLKRLRDEKIVVIDSEYSDIHPGKYYELAEKVSEYFIQRYETALDEFEDKVSEYKENMRRISEGEKEQKAEAVEKLAGELRQDLTELRNSKSSVESSFTVNKSIQSIILENINRFLDVEGLSDIELLERFQEPDTLGGLNQIMNTITVTQIEDVIAIHSVLVRAMKEIEEISAEIEERIKIQQIPKDQIGQLYLYLFTGPLASSFED